MRPIVALRALAALAANPDDLPKVFTVIEALPGRTPERLVAGMQSSPEGRRVLAAKPDLAARLADRTSLRALPEGSLGRAYVAFVEREGITPQGIVEASVEGTLDLEQVPDDVRFAGDRMRDTHDLWHVVTGYGPDLLGEAALLCFTYAQTRHPGIAFVALLAILKSVPNARPVMMEGYRRGRRAAWLPAVAWEDLLERPLTEVRERLHIGPPPAYEPVTSAALRERGVLRDRAAA
jgi:ubiquinone biosynthesis protein COQ4